MADVITLKDGSVEIIFEPKDFQYLMEKHLGYEAVKYFQSLIENYEIRIEEAEEGINTDLRCYEMSLESNTRAFQEIEEICRNMISDFNREEGRNKLNALRPWYKRICEIIKIIHNQI